MPRCRPFKLIDAMILIAAAAIGMAMMRTVWNQFQVVVGTNNGVSLPWQTYVYAEKVRSCSTIAILMLAVAYVWIRLVPPRLPTRDLIRQPGMLSLVLMTGLSTLLWPLSAFVPLKPPTNAIFALVLGLSWCVACRRYRSRAEPGWMEGLGRVFGVGLVIAIAAG
jgi:hypothetical protein